MNYIMFFKVGDDTFRFTNGMKRCLGRDYFHLDCKNSKNHGFIGCHGCLMNDFNVGKVWTPQNSTDRGQRFSVPTSTLFLFREESL